MITLQQLTAINFKLDTNDDSAKEFSITITESCQEKSKVKLVYNQETNSLFIEEVLSSGKASAIIELPPPRSHIYLAMLTSALTGRNNYVYKM